jgi:ribonuclease HI
MIEAWFDGCCEPKNPGGNCGFGAVMYQDKKRIWDHSGFIPASPETSNNVGEYLAFIAILERLIEMNFTDVWVKIYGDSKLVIEQMFGTWSIKSGFYVPHAVKARKLLEKFTNIKGEWIPREQNGVADELSKAELIKRNVEFRIQPLETSL